MLDKALGSVVTREGISCVETRPGAVGHVLFGPYMALDPGRYAVLFTLAMVAQPAVLPDDPCVYLDVVSANATAGHAVTALPAAELDTAFRTVTLTFTVPHPAHFEFRAFVSGEVALLIELHRRVVPLGPDEADDAATIAANLFPDPSSPDAPAFLRDNVVLLRSFYEAGMVLRPMGDDLLLRSGGVTFRANRYDDVRFVGEIFLRQTYNLLVAAETCVIDVGMNVGLVSLQFADKPWVREVHAFEPFHPTYERALANLSLNPALKGKITTYPFGLAGADETATVLIERGFDSGQFSIAGDETGTPHTITVRAAAAALRPIIRRARARGLVVVAKIDCEGAEYAIFESLEAAGLLRHLSAVMVEWHRTRADRDQRSLLTPLLRHGFVAVDLSPREGNGFFYAVRAAGVPGALSRKGRSAAKTSAGLISAMQAKLFPHSSGS